MAKKRPPNWRRGGPRSDRSEQSDTAGTDFLRTFSVEGTRESSDPASTEYVPLPEGTKRARFPLSGGMLSAILAAIVLVGGVTLYVANLKTDIAVAGSEIRALQKSHESWTSLVRDQVKKLEESMERRLGELESALRGRQGVAPPLRPPAPGKEGQ